jgi:hypothetical protein
MTQPTFVPIAEVDQVRPARHLHVPRSWTATRPAELKVPNAPRGRTVGTPGPDSGFALRLARRLEHELRLREGETEHDVIVGVALVGAKRAALFGRAPSIYDVRFALDLWGFLDEGAEPELVERRRSAFSSVSHDYVAQRALVDSVDEATLRLPQPDAGGQAASGA